MKEYIIIVVFILLYGLRLNAGSRKQSVAYTASIAFQHLPPLVEGCRIHGPMYIYIGLWSYTGHPVPNKPCGFCGR